MEKLKKLTTGGNFSKNVLKAILVTSLLVSGCSSIKPGHKDNTKEIPYDDYKKTKEQKAMEDLLDSLGIIPRDKN